MAKSWTDSAAPPEKHSVTLRGHRTSVSLEPAFWRAFCAMAARRGQGRNALAAEIDAARPTDLGLASAIRLAVLADWAPASMAMTSTAHSVEAIAEPGARRAAVATLLAALPAWFDRADARARYAEDAAGQTVLAVSAGGETLGLLALAAQTPAAAEIAVLAVRETHHRRGIGQALVAAAAARAAEADRRYLTALTLSSQHPDPGYAGSRAFYAAMGFHPVADLPWIWDQATPAVLYLCPLQPGLSQPKPGSPPENG